MKFSPGNVPGVWVVDLDPIADHRGFFARAWCRSEFVAHGLQTEWEQSNVQFSPHAGTLRGIHYQAPPHAEVKLVRCTAGAVFDVAIDVREGSPTFGQWSGVELSADTHRAVWIPEGFAHGYVTLVPDTEVFYLTSHEYVPDSVRAVRPDDPGVAITWPRPIKIFPAGVEEWPWLVGAETVSSRGGGATE